MTKRKRRNYSNEFKEDAVKLVTEQGLSGLQAKLSIMATSPMIHRVSSLIPEGSTVLDGHLVSVSLKDRKTPINFIKRQ